MYQFAVSNICILFKLSLNLCTELLRLPILVRNIFLLSQPFFFMFILCTSFTFFLNRFALLAAAAWCMWPIVATQKLSSDRQSRVTWRSNKNDSSAAQPLKLRRKKEGKIYKIKQKKGKKQQRQKMKFSLFFFAAAEKKKTWEITTWHEDLLNAIKEINIAPISSTNAWTIEFLHLHHSNNSKRLIMKFDTFLRCSHRVKWAERARNRVQMAFCNPLKIV